MDANDAPNTNDADERDDTTATTPSAPGDDAPVDATSGDDPALASISGSGAPSGHQASRRHRERPPNPPPPPASSARGPGMGVFATAIKDINRLREIGTVLTRHGFYQIIQRIGLDRVLGERFAPPEDTEPVNPSDPRGTARRLRLALEDLGTTFIKLGQILSTRHDLLPHVYIQEFARLQDRVPPMPFEQVEAQLQAAFQDPLGDLFRSIDPHPLATASIAQAHAAVTLDGDAVVLKVQRPNVAELIRSDLDILHAIARLLEATIQEMSLYSVVEIVREFERAILQEINFDHEATNITRFRHNFADNDAIRVPRVFAELSTTTVLTMERLVGDKFRDLEPNSPRAQHLVGLLLESTYAQIFEHGFFHADPHPGNLFVLDDATIGIIDFGLVGHLSRGQQEALVTLVITLLSGDTDGIARTLLRMGRPQGRINLADFKREINATRDKYIDRNINDIDIGAFTTEIMDAAIRYQIKLNSEYSLLAKAIITLDGVIRNATPDLDLKATAAPFAKRLLLQRYSSQRVLQNVLSGAMNLSGFLRDIPAQLDQVLMDLESGTVTIQTRSEALDRLHSDLASLGTRVSLALLASALILGSCVLLAQYDLRPFDIPILLILAAVAIVTAISLALTALAWPLLKARFRKVQIRPLVSFFRRRNTL